MAESLRSGASIEGSSVTMSSTWPDIMEKAPLTGWATRSSIARSTLPKRHYPPWPPMPVVLF